MIAGGSWRRPTRTRAWRGLVCLGAFGRSIEDRIPEVGVRVEAPEVCAERLHEELVRFAISTKRS